jgi:Sulfotransferase family
MIQCNTENLPVLLHLHIPKSAGTALNECILEVCRHPEWSSSEGGRLASGVYYAPVSIEGQFVPDEHARTILRRDDLRAVVGHFSFGLHEFIDKSSTYVTVLRRPLDRIVSLYHHVLRWDHESVHEEVITRGMSLEDFATDLPFTEIDNAQTCRIAGVQVAFGRCDRSLLDRAQNNLSERFAMVGLTERLAESVVLMKHRLAWPRLPAIKEINVNDAKPQDEAVPASVIDRILERNQLDLELYAFAERQFHEQLDAAEEACREELSAVRQTSSAARALSAS